MSEMRYMARKLGSTDTTWEFRGAQHLEDCLRFQQFDLSRHRCPHCQTRMVQLHRSAVPRGLPGLVVCSNDACSGAMYYIPRGGELTRLPPEKYLEMRRAGL